MSDKGKINGKEISKERFFHEGEIWWGSLGINIGSEQDGKNELFERPLLIVKKFHQGAAWAVPLTSGYKNDRFHYYISAVDSHAILSQLRLISTKRVTRYVKTIGKTEFWEIIKKIKNLFP